MTNVDRDMVLRLIEEVSDYLSSLKEICKLSIDEYLSDRRNPYTLRYLLIVIVESSSKIAVSILERDFGVLPRGYRESFTELYRKGVVRPSVGTRMEKLASLRNMLVHRYWEVDDLRLYEEARGGGIEAIESFLGEVRAYVSKDP